MTTKNHIPPAPLRDKYKPYPKYKPSSVEWIGEIPEGWEVRRLTTLLKSLESGGREKDSIEIEDGVISIGGEHIGWQGEMLIDNPRYISLKYYDSMNKGKVKSGDVLLVKDGATIGKTAFVVNLPKKAALNEHVFLMRAKDEITQKYLFYYIFCQIGQEQIKLYITGSAQPGLNKKFKLFTYLTFPPLPEQQAIAAFLDRETERIQTIIDKQTRMIELLKEKRTALITQAVTKGLYSLVSPTDPEFGQWAKPVKYKPSGVEWIGEIPEGWEVKDFKFIFKYHTGGTPRSTNRSFYEGDLIWVTIADLGERQVFSSKECLNIKGVQEANIPISPKGSLLISFKLSPGIVSFAGVDLYTNEAIATILPTNKIVDLNFWYYVFQDYFVLYANENIYGAKLFNQRAIKNSILAIPPLAEQQAIAAFLDRETAKIDTLVHKIEKQIELLNEYKQSLITHAVTGKIDVRELV